MNVVEQIEGIVDLEERKTGDAFGCCSGCAMSHVVLDETAVAEDNLPSAQRARRRKATRPKPPTHEKPTARRSSGETLN